MERITVHIVPSTHWDREWYLTQRDFQFRLVRLMDTVLDLLDREDYPHFLLDGQTVMVEDYLEIRPENRERVSRHIRDGKLIVGPWYAIPDFFIPSGESIIRNLAIGQALAGEYGKRQDVAYTPDSFGLASQLPQIFSRFGLRGAVFCRGLRTPDGGPGAEFTWRSPDGSALPALYEAYSTGIFLSYPDIWRNLDLVRIDVDALAASARALLERQDALYSSARRLWIVGIDHIEPRGSLPEVVRLLNERIPEAVFLHSSVEAYFAGLGKDAARFGGLSGEQRGPEREHFVLGNTASARMDIKLANRQSESLLLALAEPLSAYAGSVCASSMDTRGFIRLAWKLLVQSHAHDSICSCNPDETNAEIKARLRQAGQIASDAAGCHLREIGSSVGFAPRHPGGGVVMVYNAACQSRTGIAEGIVRIPAGLAGERFAVLDEGGNAVPGAAVRLLAKKRQDLETMKMSDAQLLQDTTRAPAEPHAPQDVFTLLDVRWLAQDVPAQGYRCYEVVPLGPGDGGLYPEKAAKDAVKVFPGGMENGFYRVSIDANGSLSVVNKASGRRLDGLHILEDEADDGDEYTFSPLPGGEKYTTERLAAATELLESGPARAIYRVRWAMELPESVVDRRIRSSHRKIVAVATDISLDAGSRVIRFRTDIDNTVKDHRMRAVFRFPQEIGHVLSDTPFDLVDRPVFSASEVPGTFIQTKPMRSALHIPLSEAGGDDALILSDGIGEYEAERAGGGIAAALTLFRSVGAVYRMVTQTRDESAMGKGTRYWTQDGQCPGRMELEYGLILAAEPLKPSGVLREGAAFGAPLKPVAVQPAGRMPPVQSFLELSPDSLVLSAVYRKDGPAGSVCVRFLQAGAAGAQARVIWHGPVRAAYETALSGERTKRLDIAKDGAIECFASPWEIKTVEIVT